MFVVALLVVPFTLLREASRCGGSPFRRSGYFADLFDLDDDITLRIPPVRPVQQRLIVATT